jgi:hypothetical protein
MMVRLICLLLATSFVFSNAYGETADTSGARLFDLETPLFGKTADKTKRAWEKEFIATGVAYEKNPENYITRILNWFQIGSPNQPAYSYLNNYTANHNRYYYSDFIHASPEYLAIYDKSIYESVYLFNHVDRSGGNIMQLWNLFGSIVSDAVSPLLKPGNKERIYVLNLVSVWECLKSAPEYNDKLEALYNLLEESYLWSDVVTTTMRPLMCPAVTLRLERMDAYLVQWYYSFWVRRHHEGNAEEIYHIMKVMLQEAAS